MRVISRELFALVSCGLAWCHHAGCAARLPEYTWVDASTALRDLADRAAAIQTISAACEITLEHPERGGVRLDGALAARNPDHLRLRAWKMNQAVFDLTLTPEGLWVWERGDATKESNNGAVALSAARVADAWRMIVAPAYENANLAIDRHGRTSSATLMVPAGPGDRRRIESVDRRSLVRRTIRAYDESGAELGRVELDDYAVSNGHLWPRRIVIENPHGRMTIDLRDVELNGELPEQAFVPPRRAVPQP